MYSEVWKFSFLQAWEVRGLAKVGALQGGYGVIGWPSYISFIHLGF